MASPKPKDVLSASSLPTPQVPGPLLTIQDLETIFRVDKRTIARWWSNGIIPHPIKVGGSNRWRVEDISLAIDQLN